MSRGGACAGVSGNAFQVKATARVVVPEVLQPKKDQGVD